MGNEKYFSLKLVIKNFKQFESKTEIVLAPITVLVGPNGEGKSSINLAIRLFSLSLSYLSGQDSHSKNIIESISFDDVVSKYSSNKTSFYLSYFHDDIEFIKIKYIRGKNGEIKIDNFVQKLTVSLNRIDRGDDNYLVPIKVFPEQYKEYDTQKMNNIQDKLEDLLVELNFSEDNYFNDLRNQSCEYKFIRTEVVGKILDGKKDFSKIIQIFSSAFYTNIFNIKLDPGGGRIKDPIFYWSLVLISLNEKYYHEVVDGASDIIEDMRYLEDCLEMEIDKWSVSSFDKFDDTRIMPPEYFEVKNGEIKNDYYGICEYVLNSNSRNYISNSRDDIFVLQFEDRDSLLKWIQNFEIGDKISLRETAHLGPSHKFYLITITKGNIEFNLHDLSSGGKQILPIILNFYSKYNGNLSLSQPELHLHPALQTKIANLIVENVFRKDKRTGEPFITKNIVLETHSEHILRKFQVLIAKRVMNNDSISVYYVNAGKAILLPLSENGLFTERWPDGFFPESTALTLDLIEELTKRQN